MVCSKGVDASFLGRQGSSSGVLGRYSHVMSANEIRRCIDSTQIDYMHIALRMWGERRPPPPTRLTDGTANEKVVFFRVKKCGTFHSPVGESPSQMLTDLVFVRV